MAITNKPLKLEQAKVISKDYNEKINKKVDAVEGKSLVDDTEITKLQSVKANAEPNTIQGIQINGEDLTPDGETKVINITAEDLAADLTNYVQDSELTEQLTPYLKSTDADGKFATKEELGNLGDLKGACLKADLEDKKAECKENDMYIVTDDDNHIYFYNGTDWTDTSAKAHVDLEPYMKTADADNKYAEKTTVESLQSTVEGLDGSLKESDIVFATDSEVLEQLQAGAEEAQAE